MLDTVRTGPNGASLLSDGLKARDEVQFWLQGEEEKPSKTKTNGKHDSPRRSAVPGATAGTRSSAVLKSKLRTENRGLDGDAQSRRKDHQRELAAKRQEEGLEKYADVEGGLRAKEKKWKRFESYARESQLPDLVKDQQVSAVCDQTAKRAELDIVFRLRSTPSDKRSSCPSTATLFPFISIRSKARSSKRREITQSSASCSSRQARLSARKRTRYGL
jgi:nucleosome binding factor SPN SPT16 subunit